MFNSKYSKLLTIILIAAIVIIIGLLVWVAINWYQTSFAPKTEGDSGAKQFDDYINGIGQNTNNEVNNNEAVNPNINVEENTTIEPNINIDEQNQNSTGNNGGTSSTNSTSAKQPTYKGFNVVGKIEIPKTKVNCVVLEKVTSKSLDASVAVLYGPGINKVGNTTISGHNYRNGTFFSNNKNLSIGDIIYLTDLQGNRIKYTIYKKYNTSVDDGDYLVRDTNGKREISLTTCTDDSKQRTIIWARED